MCWNACFSGGWPCSYAPGRFEGSTDSAPPTPPAGPVCFWIGREAWRSEELCTDRAVATVIVAVEFEFTLPTPRTCEPRPSDRINYAFCSWSAPTASGGLPDA